MLWLDGCLGIEPRLVILQVNQKLGAQVRPSRLREEGSAGRAPTLHQFLGPGIYLTTEENHGKTSVRARET